MTYLYLLAGENLELAEAELQGFLKSQGIQEKPERTTRLAETDKHPGQLKRLALTHEVTEKIAETSRKELEIQYRPENSFAVRVKNLNEEKIESKELEKEIGALLSTEDNSVDLEDPDELLKAYVTGEKLVIARMVQSIDRSLFNKRSNEKRPFSSPISLDPVLARVMINLSEASAGEKLIDPFCGTGGILIEAGLCGIGVYGLDIQQEMVEGCRKNLEEYGIISHDIRQGDIQNIEDVFDEKFEAVVTDLPYGKASKIEGSPAETFLQKASNTGEKVVFMSNREKISGREADFSVYVHKNLTRHIFIE